MSTKANTAANQKTLENLIIAVLAVNNFSLTEALQLRPALAEDGITRLSVFEKEIPSAFRIKTIIMDAGYSRGDYVALLLGERIKSVLESIKSFGHDKFLVSLREDEEVAGKMAGSLYGVGPKVIQNFISLQFGHMAD
jgi:hypothetical protein